jgi:hypothetical protein
MLGGRAPEELPMIFPFLVAATLAQGVGPEVFAQAAGWSIARQGSACMMTREFGDEGNSIFAVSVDPDDATLPLTLLVGNGSWSPPEAEDEGYHIEFIGSGAAWRDLAVRTFTTDGGDGTADGVISIGFADDAVVPMLEDVGGASGLHLSREGVTVVRLSFVGSDAAVRSLGECLTRR